MISITSHEDEKYTCHELYKNSASMYSILIYQRISLLAPCHELLFFFFAHNDVALNMHSVTFEIEIVDMATINTLVRHYSPPCRCC